MAFEQIIFETSGRVALLTLNRPEKLNAWTPTMSRELSDAMYECDAALGGDRRQNPGPDGNGRQDRSLAGDVCGRKRRRQGIPGKAPTPMADEPIQRHPDVVLDRASTPVNDGPPKSLLGASACTNPRRHVRLHHCRRTSSDGFSQAGSRSVATSASRYYSQCSFFAWS